MTTTAVPASGLTIPEVEQLLEQRDQVFVNDRSRRKIEVAVEDTFTLIEWARVDPHDVGDDELGDYVFTALTDEQADLLADMREQAIVDTTDRLWELLKTAVAAVAVRFHQEHPDAPLRKDRPRDEAEAVR